MKVNVIGDIHGRTNWKNVVIPDGINVFVGDYFDPYTDISANSMVENFLEIMDFKSKRPETILLYGNHDFHYIVPAYGGTTSRYSRYSAKRFKEVFDEFTDQFHGIAYAPDSTHLITHAGVTKEWLDRYLDRDDLVSIDKPDGSRVPITKEMEHFVNRLWYDSKETETSYEKYEFSFMSNFDYWDTYGETPTQSPIWIRPTSLISHNAYSQTGVIQIVGHTQVNNVVDLSKETEIRPGEYITPGLILVDCLGQKTESCVFDSPLDNLSESEMNYIRKSIEHGR